MINTIIVLALIACTAFFVAAEYAVIRARMSRIEQLVAEGNKKASAVKQIVARLDEYLSACQLGNTLTNLALGWLGESTVEHLLSPVFGLFSLPESVETVVSFVIAFLILTFLEVVVGELLPKIVAIQKAESLALALARPLMMFFKLTYPFSWLLNRSARLLTGLFGMKPLSEQDNTRTEAELRLILSEGYKSGIINSSEFRYVTNIFELDDMVAKGIMIPRRDVAFIDESETVQEVVARTSLDAYDLYPVTAGGDKDTIVGLIDYKELLTAYIRHPGGAGHAGQALYRACAAAAGYRVGAGDLVVDAKKGTSIWRCCSTSTAGLRASSRFATLSRASSASGGSSATRTAAR
ncbi:hemolysin family protein [Cohnella ginsengisoli]|uniref:Hemolysin family protein n=1 Tax=Cohnella ginsengisoli TaxID=425004 RepID=A0A9X4KLU5_9BACL|nr:hemolysin family protein [Cohnella ginsengisoli]MDG0794291.1 hemolysin family protein [Cohnella ginsengisoli]